MGIKFVDDKKLTEELKKSGASVTQKEEQAYKNFINPKPVPTGQFYRFRLLYFSDSTNKRTIPFIEKFCHTVYNHDEIGKLTGVDYVTCPTSPYLNIKNAWKKCPICQYANKQFELCESSNWKNKTASAAHRKTRRQFVSFIPVFVVKDPNVPENSGRVMIVNLRDKNAHEKLCDIIKAAEYDNNVYNGTKAIDLAIVVQEKPQMDKEGNPRINKNTGEPYTYRDYTFKFSDKPYDIDIPIDQVEALGFDDSMYTFSDDTELSNFLTEYTVPANVPDDDISIDLSPDTPPVTETKPVVEAPDDDFSDFGSKEPVTDEQEADVEIAEDINFSMPDASEEPSTSEKEELIGGDINIDDVMKDFEDLEVDDIPM